MFANLCTECGKRQLIFPSQISSVHNTETGIRVDYTCWCGAAQTWDAAHDNTSRPLVAA